MSLPLIFPPVEVDGQVLIDGGTMNNVPADVVKAMGADKRRGHQRRRPRRSRGPELHDVRRRRQHDRRDDARLDPARAGLGRHRRQRPAGRVRLARLAARRRTDGRGLPRRRAHARRSCCRSPSAKPTSSAWRARTPGAPPQRDAGAGVHRAGRVRRTRSAAPEGAAGAPRRGAGRRGRDREGPRGDRRPGSLPDGDLAARRQCGARHRPRRARAASSPTRRRS